MRLVDPFREFDQLFSSFNTGSRTGGMMPMDAFRTEDGQFVIRFDLPGVHANDVEITVEDQVLTVTATRSFEDTSGADWLVRERPHGTHSRQIRLGRNLDGEGINARYDQGVLSLTIPMKEEAKPRKVEIEVGNGQHSNDRVLETSSA